MPLLPGRGAGRASAKAVPLEELREHHVIAAADLQLGEPLGEGAFGEVCAGAGESALY